MPGFDAHRPPEPSVIDDCVHCGFCLDSCPTYTLWSDEADSPRGRIVLMAEALAEDGELSEEMVTHFDRCLGCMACVTACPSGVAYDRLIERTRPQVERNYARPAAERAFRRLLFETLPHPRRMRALAPLLAVARRLPLERVDERLAMAAKVAPRASAREVLRTRLPTRVAAAGEPRGRVGLLLGCVQRVFFPDVHRATMATLAAEGFEVHAPRAPDCCGALELHAGAEEAAIARARKTIAAFADVKYVVTNAAGCGSAMKDYGALIEDAPARLFSLKVRDVSELLASVEPRTRRGPVPLRVVYHDACHLAHAQGIREEPRELLRAIPGLELLEVEREPQICCGSAGIYNLVEPEAAAALGARKAANLIATGAEAIVAGNPGCAAQIDLHLREAGHPLPIYHPIELLWRSLQAGR
ncbi:MAG TPA: heterodisulfide reductase-related iron-sulfur binding cluster [Solirubrobacteraceae bacterium]|nr:heterodisulfide reductase-related iron-sulfur binding cluster [Solirubrobacteraceae bacterium]